MKDHAPYPHVKQKSNPFGTASVVTTLSVAERALGFLYRIVLSRLIGAEGLGLYQVALSLFSVFLTIGTGGIPITVSRLISKSKAENNPKGERAATSAGFVLSLILTLPVAVLLGLFAQHLPFLFSDDRAVPVFKVLLLGLVFSSLYAVVRGSFWGNKQLVLPSVLEIAEETVMVIVGVLLLQNVQSAADGALSAGWAATISYLFSFTAAIICFLVSGKKLASPKHTVKPLFQAALPITSVRAGGSLVNSAVAVLLPAMLIRAGASEAEAVGLFGIVSGMATPVLFIPATIIGAISLVLVPELSEDFYAKRFERLYKNIRRGLSAAFLIACAIMPFFYVLGDSVGKIAFSEPLAGEFIRNGCPLLLPMSLTMISTGMLNSMGFEKQTFLYYFLSAAAMLLCILLLPALCGAYAYVIGLGISYVVNAVCNLALLAKKCPTLFKRTGQGRVHALFKAFVLLLPLSLLGKFFFALFSHVLGEITCLLCTTLALAILTTAAYLLFKIVSLPKREKKCKILLKNVK